jgi:hypothetical protein
MKTLTRDQEDGLWDKFWSEMNREWFKIEVLQDYTGEDDGPSLRAWKEGDRNRSIELLKTDEDPEFTNSCQQKISHGVVLYRVHIVDEPLSEYMEWEMKYYEHVTIRLRGERVFIARKFDLDGLDLPLGDVMIFDRRRAIVNSYDQNGLMKQADFYDENDNISHFLELRKTLKSLARPIRI